MTFEEQPKKHLEKFVLLAHFDWSIQPTKRWQTVAVPSGSNTYRIVSSSQAPPCPELFPSLQQQANEGPIFAGFDFPIGLPMAYAEKCNIVSFREMLPRFGHGEWADFYNPALVPEQIQLKRPFYPQRAGGTKKYHQLDALGLNSSTDLLRQCERATSTRPKACELFWTLGANQVGKAAITGWRDLLAPALQEGQINLWPFDGELTQLLQPRRITVAEVYPAEFYSRLGIPSRFGKTTQHARAAQAPAILSWCRSNQVTMPQDLRLALEVGFNQSVTGEDQFDSLVGLLGMIESVRHPSRFAAPDPLLIQSIEGWILGR